MDAVRSFDPVTLGGHEADAWVAYYQRRWAAFLRAAIGLVREGFGLPWPATLRGAWHVMRANQAWAPYPDNDPDQARAYMRGFYAWSRVRTASASTSTRRPAWRSSGGGSTGTSSGRPETLDYEPLTDALAALYAHVYGVPADAVREAAAHRAEAMRISDAWVEAGATAGSPAIATERDELVKGYALLRAAVAAP